MTLQSHSQTCIQRKKCMIQKDTGTPMFTAHCLQQPRCGCSLNVHREWVKKMWCVYIIYIIYIHTQWDIVCVCVYIYIYIYITFYFFTKVSVQLSNHIYILKVVIWHTFCNSWVPFLNGDHTVYDTSHRNLINYHGGGGGCLVAKQCPTLATLGL